MLDRPVFELLGVEQLAAGIAALQHDRLQHRPPCIHRSGHASRPCSDDYQIVFVILRHVTPLLRSPVVDQRA